MSNKDVGDQHTPVVMTREHLMTAPQRYKLLLLLLASDFEVTETIANVIGFGADLDLFAGIIIKILSLMNANLSAIRWLIKKEITSSPSLQGSLFRGNGLLSKLESEFIRMIACLYRTGYNPNLILTTLTHNTSHPHPLISTACPCSTSYLKEALGGFIERLIAYDGNLDITQLSIDGILPTVLEQQLDTIKDFVDSFLQRIISDEMIEKMPRQVRTIAWLIKVESELYLPEKKVWPLVGGFIMLRFLLPALVSPDSFCILKVGQVLSIKSRRNVFVIAKVVQNISNGLCFKDTKKDLNLAPLDTFILSYFQKINKYYQKLVVDPRCTSSDIRSWTDQLVRPSPPEFLNIQCIEFSDLFTLHQLIDKNKAKLANTKGVQKLNPVIDELSPIFSSGIFHFSSSNEPPSIKATSSIYQGPNDRQGQSVLYITASKVINRSLLPTVNQLLKFINDSPSLTTIISLVLDFSWTAPLQVKNFFVNNADFIANPIKMTELKDKHRFHRIHIVNSTSISHSILSFFISFFAQHYDIMVLEHERWQTLSTWIEISKIKLPSESLNYLSKGYRVIKVNAKGRRQDRIVKFTGNSILNISNSGNFLKNEVLFDDIREIHLLPNGMIRLHLLPDTVRSVFNHSSSLLDKFKFSDRADLLTRTYICTNEFDFVHLVQDILESSFTKTQMPSQQYYVAIIKSGRSQQRTLKFTGNSLMILNNKSIDAEVAFTRISQATFDPKSPLVLQNIWLKDRIDPMIVRYNNFADLYGMNTILNARINQLNVQEVSEAMQTTSIWLDRSLAI